MPRPVGPNTAPATGRKTKPFQRITPWNTLVKPGSLTLIRGLAASVANATANDTAMVLSATGPAVPALKSAPHTAGTRKAG